MTNTYQAARSFFKAARAHGARILITEWTDKGGPTRLIAPDRPWRSNLRHSAANNRRRYAAVKRLFNAGACMFGPHMCCIEAHTLFSWDDSKVIPSLGELSSAPLCGPCAARLARGVAVRAAGPVADAPQAFDPARALQSLQDAFAPK
jgi:hypothetical protein